MRNRGLYGQAEGNESRSSAAILAERIEENQAIEGQHVATLRRMCKESDWKAVERYCGELRTKQFSQHRIDSMLTSAMAGIRLR